MKYPLLCCLGYLFFITHAHAQREANNWYFGNKAGLSFHHKTPKILFDSKIEAPEGSAVISDKSTGALLFYSNGESVWNRGHQVMPHGANMLGSRHATQSALIVPMPEDDNLFYLFTLSSRYADNEKIQLHYSIIDMRLDEGRGDVVELTKNTFISEGLTEKLTAIPHVSEDSYWLLTHQIESDVFTIYLITASGISDPIHQAIGSEHRVIHTNPITTSNGDGGYLKASPDGTLIASAEYIYTGDIVEPAGAFELFDFDAQTGTLSNHRHLGNLFAAYGVSFSSDNSKLYLTGYRYEPSKTDPIEFLHQFDLNAENIKASRIGYSKEKYYGLGTGSQFVSSALQLAPDGKIYYLSSSYTNSTDNPSENHENYLYYINFPNRKGTDIDIGYHAVDYGEGYNWLGLPNFMQHYFQDERIRAPGNPEDDPCNPRFAIQLFPNPSSSQIQIRLHEGCFMSDYTLQIVAPTGQVLTPEFYVDSNTAFVEVNSLASGLYFAELRFGDKVVSKKFIVE